MKLDLAIIEDFNTYLKKQGKQPATIESYCRDAKGFVDYLLSHSIAFGSIEPKTLLTYQDYLLTEQRERENSIRRKIIGIRQFFRFVMERQNIPHSPLDDVPIPAREESLQKGPSHETINLLITEALQGHPMVKAARDAALIALIAYEGLKAGEIIALKWSDYLSEKNYGSLKIIGTRSRVIRLDSKTTGLVDAYHRHFRTLSFPKSGSHPFKSMFISFKGRDSAVPVPHITRHGIKFVLYELGESLGISNLNTENLRHHATEFLIGKGLTPEDIMSHFGLKRIGNIAKHIAAAQETNSL